MAWLPDGENSLMMFSRFDTIPRVTDGQTDIFPQHSLRSAVKMIVANIFAVANVFKSSF